MLEHATEWESISNVYYSKFKVYDLEWQLNTFEPYHIVSSPYSSTLAIYRDNSKLVPLSSSQLLGNGKSINKPTIFIYTVSGIQIGTINASSTPIAVGFTKYDRLVIIYEDGFYKVYNYSRSLNDVETHRIESNDNNIIDARICEDDTMVVLTSEFEFIEIKNGISNTLTNVDNFHDKPHDWNVIPSTRSNTAMTTVIANINDGIFAIDSLTVVKSEISEMSINTFVKPSPNGRFIATLTSDKVLSIITSDFSKEVTKFDMKVIDNYVVNDLIWCGSNAIGLIYDEPSPRMWLIGPGGEHILYPYAYENNIKAFSTNSSSIVLTPTSVDIITKVPLSIQQTFLPGSTNPSALLLSAFEQFENQSSKSDDSVRAIGSDLFDGVIGCINAASELWNIDQQRKLLKASQFGFEYLDSFNTQEFLNVGNKLRVINNFRHPNVGIPLNINDYNVYESEHILQLLISRQLHLLALKICQHLKMRCDFILSHWACCKILNSQSEYDDEALVNVIVERVQSVTKSFIGWSDVAKVAYNCGRLTLATKMLDNEPRANEVVPQLVRMKEDKLALLKAIQSNDPDLIIDVLLYLRSRLSLGDFFRVLESGGSLYESANKLLIVYAKSNDRDMVRDYYFQDDRKLESARLELEEIKSTKTKGEVIEKVKAAQTLFADDKKRSFEAKMCNEYLNVIKNYDKENVNDILNEMLLKDDIKSAEKVKQEFKISEKRYWHLRIRALAKKHDWQGLEDLANSRKSPIGYEPFYRAVKETGNKKLMIDYIKRLDNKRKEELMRFI